MTENAYGPSNYQPYGPYPRPSTPPLRRSRTDRTVAGVCGGLARSLGVDATLLRVLTVVGAVLTGGGLVLAYLVAWLIIPDDDAYAAPPSYYAPGGYPPPGYYAAPQPQPQPQPQSPDQSQNQDTSQTQQDGVTR